MRVVLRATYQSNVPSAVSGVCVFKAACWFVEACIQHPDSVVIHPTADVGTKPRRRFDGRHCERSNKMRLPYLLCVGAGCWYPPMRSNKMRLPYLLCVGAGCWYPPPATWYLPHAATLVAKLPLRVHPRADLRLSSPLS